MSLAQDLVGIGMVPEQALRLGFNSRSQNGAGTTQGTAAAIAKDTNLVLLNAQAGQAGAILPTTAELMVPYIVYNTGAAAATVYCPTGQTINGVAAATGVAVAVNISRMFMRIDTTRWASWLAA